MIKVSLFGHRNFDGHNLVEKKLFDLFSELLATEEYIDIYIGRDGEYDIFAASVIKRIKKALGDANITMNLVLPYLKKDIEYYETYYDSIIVPEAIAKSHYKAAITKRNRWMVEESELLICYVNCEKGGAFSAMKYAKKLGKRVVNLV